MKNVISLLSHSSKPHQYDVSEFKGHRTVDKTESSSENPYLISSEYRKHIIKHINELTDDQIEQLAKPLEQAWKRRVTSGASALVPLDKPDIKGSISQLLQNKHISNLTDDNIEQLAHSLEKNWKSRVTSGASDLVPLSKPNTKESLSQLLQNRHISNLTDDNIEQLAHSLEENWKSRVTPGVSASTKR